MSPIQELIDQRRALAAKVAGLDIQICTALGDRQGAERAKQEMYAQVEARRAMAALQPCYFHEEGKAA